MIGTKTKILFKCYLKMISEKIFVKKACATKRVRDKTRVRQNACATKRVRDNTIITIFHFTAFVAKTLFDE